MNAPDAALPARSPVGPPDGLLQRLRAACLPEWHAYSRHAFVLRLADGTLPQESFRHYLIQDYLFLVQFARAYALAAYKADDVEDMRQATRSLAKIIDAETSLHVRFCARWGIPERDILAAPEATATMAYTRYVLERGAAGDILDLLVALAPCVVGYAEIALERMADPATRVEGNPYREWLEMYSGPDYVAVATDAATALDRHFARRGGPGRMPALEATFRGATRLEAQFWQMGLDRAT
ncbi:MAG: thiaminase II [Alphaproteobacteria bacterium]|nr:thiaminase II [Alphaproteobacteria bacterium]